MALTLKTVERFRLQPGRYGDGRGLYLQIVSPTNCSWLFRYERAGRERWMGLGAVHTFSLPEARERARRARQQLADGVDPMEARTVERAQAALSAARRMTFRQCSEGYFADNGIRWRNAKHRAQFKSSLATYAYPILGDIPVAEIDVALVLKVLKQPMEGKTFWLARPETASRLRSRIEKVLSWATVLKYREGDNSARWRNFISTQLPSRGKKRPHPALPYDELPEFLIDLRQRTAVAAKALEFLILCTARSGAVIGARWTEIDFKEKVWSVPPDRAGTKIFGDKPRRIPLSARAIEILQELPRERGNNHVFIGGRPGAGMSGAAIGALIERMQEDRVRNGLPRYTDPKLDGAGITPHGFRSSFKDWASEITSHPNFISEAALWHVVADKVEAAYRRGDLFEKRKRMMSDWARFCASPSKGCEVVPLRRAAK